MAILTITFDARMSEHTGIGTYVKNILREISKDEGIELRVICRAKNSLNLSGSPQTLYCDTDIYTVKEQWDLLKYLPKSDERHFFWSPHINIPLFYRGPNLVVTVHDLLFYEKAYFPQTLAKNLYRDLFFSRLTKKAKIIFTPSNFTKGELVKRFPSVAEKTHAVHLGVGDQWRIPKVGKKDKTIVFVGNLKQNKNLGLLVDAFNLVKDKIPHKLHIIGASQGLRTSEDISRFKIDPDRVVIEKRLPEDELVARVSRAELVVCPSLYEGFGLVPLEAYMVGSQVLCSDIPVHKEVMGGHAEFFRSGDVQDCADKILTSLDDVGIRPSIDYEQGFQWAVAAQKKVGLLTLSKV